MKIRVKLLVLFMLFISTRAYSQGLFVITMNNLDFGDVYIGYSKTVAHTDAGAAKFRTYHTRPGNRNLQITFTLPSSLVYSSYSVPITFGPTTSAYSLTDLPTGRTNFDPQTPLYYYGIRRDINLYIWLGGSVNIPTNVIPGTYTGTITITVVMI